MVKLFSILLFSLILTAWSYKSDNSEVMNKDLENENFKKMWKQLPEGFDWFKEMLLSNEESADEVCMRFLKDATKTDVFPHEDLTEENKNIIKHLCVG